MKKIDFLPEWYKSGTRSRLSLRRQYIALATVLFAMIVWNFTTTHALSKADAAIVNQNTAQSASHEVTAVRDEISRLQQKANLLEAVVPKSSVAIADILAELSFLVDPAIVLTKVEFIAERFAHTGNSPSALIHVAGKSKHVDKKWDLLLGDVKFKLIITGIAAHTADVAQLVCKLEDSPYFCQVYPSFSKSVEISAPGKASAKRHQANEFEIACYLANYEIADRTENLQNKD